MSSVDVSGWRFPGTRGWSEVVFEGVGQTPDGISLYKIDLRGSSWDLRQDLESAELVRDFESTLFQIPVREDKLVELRECLQMWLSEKTLFDLSLVDGPEHHLRVALEVRDDCITSPSKPALVIRYSGAPLKIVECAFVIDQTCIVEALSGMAGTAGTPPAATHPP